MRTKLIYVENGKITFTRKELEDLLQDTYDEGYRDGSSYYNTATRSNQTITIRNGNKTGDYSWEHPFSYTSNSACSSTISADSNYTISTADISCVPLNISTENIADGAITAILNNDKNEFSNVKNVAAYSTISVNDIFAGKK